MSVRVNLLLGSVLLLLSMRAYAQDQTATPPPTPSPSHPLEVAAVHPSLPAQGKFKPRPKFVRRVAVPRTAAAEAPAPAASAPKQNGLTAAITLADIGFVNGLHFSDLGGHHELYVPLPDDADVSARDLVLVFDDFAANDKRNLIVQINDRTVAAIALDGNGRDRTLQLPLGGARPKDGYLKLAFFYSGAATPDHCIDVRYVGDSVTIRPQTAVEIDVAEAGSLDVATTAELMPRDVAVVLPARRLAETEMATAITVARALISSGRRVSFYDGYNSVADLAKRDDSGRWTRGIILVGPLADAEGVIDSPIATVAGDLRSFGMIDAVRIHGLPSLVIADAESVRAARLFGTPMLAATRGIAAASVGQVSPIALPKDRITFDQLGIPPEEAEVYGRADLGAILDMRRLPAGTRPTRLSLDVMVAPDGAGAKAVVSAFVNERLLGSTVAATDEATHLDLPLPDGLVGTLANLRVVVERDIAQGNCRFGPQGYPAQILGSSALVLGSAGGSAQDFSDLTARFVRGLDVLLPASAADQPTHVLGLIAEVANQLSPDTTPIDVGYVAAGSAPVPEAPFIAVSDLPPAGATPRVRFDSGRVAVIDQSGHTLLDLGGFTGGAVAQVLQVGDTPGLWIKPLAPDGQAPSPPDIHLDHGDVAFIDQKGVALAMSTVHDTLVRISYPDQVSWLTVAGRFRSWIIAGLWLLATAVLLLTLQRLFRRRPANPTE
jgi:cellulose synthase operon protein B